MTIETMVCHGFDGQCGASRCKCYRYELVATLFDGDWEKIMNLMGCSDGTAKRVAEWYSQKNDPTRMKSAGFGMVPGEGMDEL